MKIYRWAHKKILLHAYKHVPFYKAAFTKNGITLQQILQITPASLHCLPVLIKEQLRIYETSALLSGIRKNTGTFFSSSGSTGTPVKILFSQSMHQKWFALFEARVRNWAGVNSSTQEE